MFPISIFAVLFSKWKHKKPFVFPYNETNATVQVSGSSFLIYG